MNPDDLARFRAGDQALFRRLVESHSPRLLGVSRGFADDLDAAHDLVQETWMRVFAKRRSYRGGSFVSWLVAVCRSVCLTSVRARARTVTSGVSLDALPDPTTSGAPARAAHRAELRSAIGHAVFDLPARQREVVVHRLIEGLSTRETAEAMGCAEGTVKAALHQALAKLAEPLRAHSDEPANPKPEAWASTGAVP